jgi:hypothetical protein
VRPEHAIRPLVELEPSPGGGRRLRGLIEESDQNLAVDFTP